MWEKIGNENLKAQSPIRIIIHKKQLENVEYFNYLGSIITNDERSNHEMKSRIAWQEQLSTRRRLFSSKLDLNLRKKLVKCYIWRIFFYCATIWRQVFVISFQIRNTWKVLKCGAGEGWRSVELIK